MKNKNVFGSVVFEPKENISTLVVKEKIEREINKALEMNIFGFKVSEIVDLKYGFEERDNLLTVNLHIGTNLFLITNEILLSLLNKYLNPVGEIGKYVELKGSDLKISNNNQLYDLMFNGNSWNYSKK